MSEYKGFTISNPPNVGTMYKVSSVGSGSVPKALRGMYTTPVEAQRDIDKHLNSVQAKTKATKAEKSKEK
jgi:hypothetical protein